MFDLSQVLEHGTMRERWCVRRRPCLHDGNHHRDRLCVALWSRLHHWLRLPLLLCAALADDDSRHGRRAPATAGATVCREHAGAWRNARRHRVSATDAAVRKDAASWLNEMKPTEAVLYNNEKKSNRKAKEKIEGDEILCVQERRVVSFDDDDDDCSGSDSSDEQEGCLVVGQGGV